MSLIDQFPGAEIAAGNVIYNRQVVAVLRNGQELLTPEGEALLNSTVDVQATVVSVDSVGEQPASAPAPKPRKAKAAPAPEPAPVADAPAPAADPTADLDSLLST
jgi:hypothetical protein